MATGGKPRSNWNERRIPRLPGGGAGAPLRSLPPKQLRSRSTALPVRHPIPSAHGRSVASARRSHPADLSVRVATLDQASVNLLAQRAQLGGRDLAGGSSTIVISTTAVIIGLLILILLTN